MDRPTMLDRCERLLSEIDTRGDEARAEFDALMRQIAATDAIEAPPIRHAGPERPLGDRYASGLPDEAEAPAPSESTTTAPTRAIGRARLQVQHVDYLERHNCFPASGIIVGGQSYGPAALRRFLESDPPPGHLDDIQVQLSAAEDRGQREDEIRAADAARAARLEQVRYGAPTDDEDRERAEILREAQEAAELQADPQRRIEQLLAEIRDGLKR